MKVFDIVKRSGRNLRSAKLRTLLTALAIAVGGFSLSITLAATNGAQSYVDNILKENFDPSDVFIYADKAVFGEGDNTAKEYTTDSNFGSIAGQGGNSQKIKLMNQSDIDKIKKIDNVESVTPRITELLPEYITKDGAKKYGGATIQQYGSRQKLDLLAGEQQGKSGRGEILLAEPFVEALGFKSANDAIGSKVMLGVKNNLSAVLDIREFEFKVIGVRKNVTSQQPGTDFAIYMYYDDIVPMYDYSGTSGQYTSVVAKVKNGNDSTMVSKVQSDVSNLGYESKSSEQLQAQINQFITTLRIVIGVFSVITLIASVFGIINTMYISVLERTREIGLMKALGMSKFAIRMLFTFEAIWIGFLGGVMGIVFSIFVGKIADPKIVDLLDLDPGSSFIKFKLVQIFILIIALMIIAMLSGVLPSGKAAKLDPIEALRTE